MGLQGYYGCITSPIKAVYNGFYAIKRVSALFYAIMFLILAIARLSKRYHEITMRRVYAYVSLREFLTTSPGESTIKFKKEKKNIAKPTFCF